MTSTHAENVDPRAGIDTSVSGIDTVVVLQAGNEGSVTSYSPRRRDPESGAVIMEWAPETGGFVRTSLRSLAITRKRMGIGPEPAFLLHRTGKGRFILEDPSTGEWVSLDAFGRDNAGEFAKLYTAAEARR